MRKITAALIVVVTVVAGLLFVLPALISTDWARSELGRQLSSASGMDIRLDGPVGVSFFPSLAVVAKDIGISDDKGGLSIKVPRFSTAVTLSSLWSDKFEIQSIKLIDPAISLGPSSEKSAGAEIPSANEELDPFASLVDTLEQLAVNRITIENASLSTVDEAGNASTVEAIDADLKVPDLDREIAFSLAATKDGSRVELDGTLSALRPILQREPAEVMLEGRMEPAPSPLLSSLKVNGEIRLNQNGSYQIRGGQFDLGGQAFQLDALFQPGERYRFLADFSAERLDLDQLSGGGDAEASVADSGSAADLSMLSSIDANVSVTIDQLVSSALSASDVQLAVALSDGQLDAELVHLKLDAGSVTAALSTNVAETPPTFQGNVVTSGLDIGAMAKLAGQTVPLSGKVTANTVIAFRGLAADEIRKSFNLRGTVGLRESNIPLAAFINQDGGGPGDITGLSLDVEIHDIAKPVDVAGNLTWQGQEVAFQSQLAPADFLSSPSIAEASAPVSLSLASNYLRVSANGTVGGEGTFKGQISTASPSLDNLLRWLGQGSSGGLESFAFEGMLDASSTGVSFSNANLDLNGVKASGEGSIKLAPKLNINTSLQFQELDFANLVAEGSGDAGDAQTSTASSDTPIDLSFLLGLDAEIAVAADRIGYGDVFAGPVKTTLVISDGVANLTVPVSRFYEGTIAANLSADGSGETPAINLDMTVTDATAAPLLTDAAGFNRLEGKLNTSLAVSGAGKTTKLLARSLNGKAAVKFSDGAVRGINIAEVYNNLVGLLTSGFKQDDEKRTTFTELGASFSIEKGIAETQDISLLGPLVRMDGSGRIDLAEQTLEINLNPRVVASLSGQGGDIETKGIGVPVIIDGSLSSPRIYPDLSKLMQDPKGALEALSSIGLPTEKLNLDKLLPGSGGSSGTGASDLIGDLIKGSGSGNSPIADGLEKLTGGNTGDAGSIAKGIIGDLLKGKSETPTAAPDAPTTPSDATATEPVQNNVATQPELDPTASSVPDRSEKGEVESLLERLLR